MCYATLTIKRGDGELETLVCEREDGHAESHTFDLGTLRVEVRIVSARSLEELDVRGFEAFWTEQ